jgi:membrane protein
MHIVLPLAALCPLGYARESQNSVLELAQRMREKWRDGGLARQAAALAYYALFAFSPLILIVVGIASMLVGEAAAAGALRDRIELLFGNQTADELANLVQPLMLPEYGAVSALLGAGILLYGAGRVFYHLQAVLDTVLEVRLSRSAASTTRVARRALPFLVVLVAGALFVLILLAQAVWHYLDTTALGVMIEPEWLPSGVGSFAWTLLIVFGVFLALYATLPSARVPRRSLLLGTALAALAYAAGETVFVRYVAWSGSQSASTAAGSVVLFLAWIHYSASVVIVGELFAATHAEWSGGQITPRPSAVRVSRTIEEPTAGRDA